MRVYVSLPLRGPVRQTGRELLRCAELALEARGGGGVELVALDSDDGHDRDAKAAGNAARAVDDPRALAYLGDFHSSQVSATAPLLSEAGLLQVAPVATFTGLTGATLVRLAPDDRVGAAATADWLVANGAQRLLVVHDHDDSYGIPVGEMCVEAARERGIETRSRPVWDHGEPMAADVDGADAVLYVGVAGSGAGQLWRDLHALDTRMWLLGSDGVAVDWLARELSPEQAERTRFFVPQRAPWGFYGYEAMALILDAIAAAGPDREEIARAARATRDRDSPLGRYSLDEHGRITSTAYGRLAVVGGELVWDR